MAAGDEAFGAEDVGGRIESAGESVDGDDVRGLVVPGTVFPPVGGGDFIPGILEFVLRVEEAHDLW